MPGPGPLLAAAAAGVVASRHVPIGGAGAVVPAALLLAVAAGLGFRVATARRGAAIVVVAALAVVVGVRAQRGLESGAVVEAARQRSPVTGWAELVTDPAGRYFTAEALARFAGRQVMLVAPRPASSRLLALGAGDRVRVAGRLAPLGARQGHLWSRHVVARLDVIAVEAVAPPRSVVVRAGNALRRVLLAGTEGVPSPERGLAAGFLVGDTRGLAPEMVEQFRRSGLSHLVVVSGANVAFVLALAGPALRRLRLAARFGGAVLLIVLFAAATRFEPSVLRASVMAGLGALAAFTGRPADRLRVLAAAALALVLVDPFLVFSVGFRLSCAASAGIVLGAQPFADRLRGPAWVREPLATTLAAQVAVAPVLIPTFGSMPLVALPANVLAAPAAGPLMVWGAISGVAVSVLGDAVPEIGAVLALPTRLLARYVATVAAVGSRVPGAVGAPGALALGGAGLLAWRRRSRRLGGDGVEAADPSRDPAAARRADP